MSETRETLAIEWTGEAYRLDAENVCDCGAAAPATIERLAPGVVRLTLCSQPAPVLTAVVVNARAPGAACWIARHDLRTFVVRRGVVREDGAALETDGTIVVELLRREGV